jgi:hypothetical protein
VRARRNVQGAIENANSDRRQCSVYALVSSGDGRIRYVGQTVQSLGARLSNHIGRANRGAGGPLHCWIRKVRSEGHQVQIVLLQESAVWNQSEVEWIGKIRFSGRRLLNQTDGGMQRRGFTLPVHARERLSEVVRARWADPAYREKIRDGHAAYWTPERRDAQRRRATGGVSTVESRQSISAGLLSYYSDPINREARRSINARTLANPDHRERRLAALRESHKDPAYRQLQRDRMRDLWRRRREGLAPARRCAC